MKTPQRLHKDSIRFGVCLFTCFLFSLLYSCSDDLITVPSDRSIYSADESFQTNTTNFFSKYLGVDEGLNTTPLYWRSDDSCSVQGDNCVHYNGYVDTVRLDTPSLCQVIVTVDIQVCEMNDSTHLISFDPQSYQIIRPDTNDANEQWCTDWFALLDSCAAINDSVCLVEMVRQVELAAADAIELAFVSDYVRFYNEVFECGDDQTEPGHKVIETEYYNATCLQGCEVSKFGTTYVEIQDCGSGCCIKKNDYCQNELGGVTRGPTYYEYTQGLCGVIPVCKENEHVFSCYSVECPE